jgi:hypothetical protein
MVGVDAVRFREPGVRSSRTVPPVFGADAEFLEDGVNDAEVG